MRCRIRTDNDVTFPDSAGAGSNGSSGRIVWTLRRPPNRLVRRIVRIPHRCEKGGRCVDIRSRQSAMIHPRREPEWTLNMTIILLAMPVDENYAKGS